jgi:hypothetical protein
MVLTTACGGVVFDDTSLAGPISRPIKGTEASSVSGVSTELLAVNSHTSRLLNLATVVSTRTALMNALTNDVVIELASDLVLSSPVTINVFTGVFINGSGYKLDGNDLVACLRIKNNAEATIFDLMITRGYSSTVRMLVQLVE